MSDTKDSSVVRTTPAAEVTLRSGPEIGPVLAEEGNYQVVQLVFHRPVLHQGFSFFAGYGVLNKDTGVLESQTTILNYALQSAFFMNKDASEQPWRKPADPFTEMFGEDSAEEMH